MTAKGDFFISAAQDDNMAFTRGQFDWDFPPLNGRVDLLETFGSQLEGFTIVIL